MLKIRFKREEVARLRVLIGYRSVKALADASGMTRQNMANLLRRDPARLSLDSLGRLCDALDCQPGDLLERVDR